MPSPRSPYPVRIDFDPPAEDQSRVLAFFTIIFWLGRTVMIIPAYFVLYFVLIAAYVVAWIAQFGILFTGHYPAGMYGFVTGVLRWQTRVTAYYFGVTDKYPPFRPEP